jgi:hypothetical protein
MDHGFNTIFSLMLFGKKPQVHLLFSLKLLPGLLPFSICTISLTMNSLQSGKVMCLKRERYREWERERNQWGSCLFW